MAGRKFFPRLFHRATPPAVVLVCAAVCLTAVSALGLRQITAQQALRAVFGTASAAKESIAAATAPASLAQELTPATPSGLAIGEYTGSLDIKTGEVKITPVSGAGGRGRFSTAGRTDANTTLPPGSFSFRLTDTNGLDENGNAIPDSIFIPSTGTVSGEIQITNNTASTFYNTRLVFTTFRVSNAGGTAASNSPSTGGVAYYNDGQVAYNNQLNVSRNYGDISAGGVSNALWTFAVPTSGPTFYFAFVVLADIGVAAESVEPAAVQVNGSTGSSINLNGRGFLTNPTVQLLNSGGTSVASLQVNSVSTTQISAAIPAGVAPGIYGVRMTNAGGTPGGIGSSAVLGRLTVTGVPSTTLSGLVNSLSGTGPFLVNSNIVIGADVAILPGTVFYFASGTTLQLASSGNLNANGGIPGISGTAPGQIVFTAQRTPGQGIPAQGAWGGIDATSSASGQIVMRNCVVEYGGLAGSAQIRLTGSGRRLRFTDSISRRSAGTGIDASGINDSLEGFARSRVDNNGSGASDVAILLSGNSALGLYDLDGTTSGTSVADANYYYSSANTFSSNTNNFVQVGTDSSAASNDFTKSGVLVGQGETPIHLRGSSNNPAIVGSSSLVELSINPMATIKLAPGMDFQAGDSAQGLRGGISANGLAGVTQVRNAAFGSSKYITFDRIGGGNWGAIYFSRNAPASSILNYVSVQNGGSSSLGSAAVLAEGVAVTVTNSEILGSSSGSVLAYAGGNIITSSAAFGSTNTTLIDTIAGGILGDGNPATKAQLGQATSIATDPLGRGLFIADTSSSTAYLRFVNTTNAPVVIANQRIFPGTIGTIAGRENGDLSENVPGTTVDLGAVNGLGVSPDGSLLYFADTTDTLIRVLNLSSNTLTVAGGTVAAGNVRTLADASASVSQYVADVAVAPNGDVLFVDSSATVNKVFKITVAGRSSASQAATVIVGRDKVGTESLNDDNPAFVAGSATNLLLYQPSAVETDAAGNVYVSDTRHGRVIKIDTSGNATLTAQFRSGASGPYPSSLAFFGTNLYTANGNQNVLVRVTGGAAIVAGTGTLSVSGAGVISGTGTSCDYTSSPTCGDGSGALSAGFNFPGTSAPTGISADSRGIYILDQTVVTKGRIRFVNLSGSPVTLAGVTIASNSINTIAGTGLPSPYDGGLASSASLSTPTGVGVDDNNNVWFTDTGTNHLRFFNRGTSPVTLFAGTAAERLVPPGQIMTIDTETSATGDDVPVNQAVFSRPQGLAITAQGIFIADSARGQLVPLTTGKRTGWLRFINTTASPVTFYANTAVSKTVPPGNILTIAGGSTSLDDLNAVGTNVNNAALIDPTDVVVNDNFIYLTDAGNGTVRKINRASGNILSLTSTALPADQRLASAKYTGLSFDKAGKLYIVNTDSGQVLRESANGSGVFAAQNTSTLNKPKDVVVDAAGNAYVTNSGTSQVLKITPAGVATVVAGISTTPVSIGFYNYGGDQGDARNSRLNINPADFNLRSGTATPVLAPQTVGITISRSGEVIFTDSNNNRIRRVR